MHDPSSHTARAAGNTRTGRDQEVELSPAQLRLLLDHLRDIIYTVDEGGRLTWASQSWEDSLGYDPGTAAGKPFVELVHPEDREAWTRMFRDSRLCDVPPGAVEYRIADGDGGWRHHRGDGTWVPEAGGSGHLFMGSAEDISDTRLAEQHQAQSEKLKSIGAMAGGIAHDIGNLLTPMIGFSQLLRDHPQNEELVIEFVEIVDTNLTKLDLLTRQLLLFGRKNDVQFYPMDLGAALTEYCDTLAREIPPNVTLDTLRDVPADEELLLRGDPAQVGEILRHLVSNALDAMQPDGGLLRLEVTLLEPESGLLPAEAGSGRWIRIRVSDTGTGIDDATRERIFEPFFTTKPKGKGDGLGLTVVAKLIDDHRGFLDVQTGPGAGSSFDVYLPLVAADEARRSILSSDD